MFKNYFSICLSVLLSTICMAQTTDEGVDALIGEWRTMGASSAAQIDITKEYWMDRSGKESRSVDSIPIVRNFPNGLMVLGKANQYALIRNVIAEDGQSFWSAVLALSPNMEDLFALVSKHKEIAATEKVTCKIAYSAKRLEAIKSAPGLDVISGEDLLVALQKRREMIPLLKKYMTKQSSADQNPYAIYRLAEPLLQREFIALGYNPYKEVIYNFEETFKNNTEIMTLLLEEF